MARSQVKCDSGLTQQLFNNHLLSKIGISVFMAIGMTIYDIIGTIIPTIIST